MEASENPPSLYLRVGGLSYFTDDLMQPISDQFYKSDDADDPRVSSSSPDDEELDYSSTDEVIVGEIEVCKFFPHTQHASQHSCSPSDCRSRMLS